VLRLGFERFARKEEIEAGARNEFRQELERRKQELIARYVARADQLDTFWHRPTTPKANGEGTPMRHDAVARPLAGRGRPARAPRKKARS